MTGPVSTRWQSPERDITLEFVEGRLVDVRIETGLVDPVHSHSLEEAMAEALNVALERHTREHLERLRAPDDDVRALVAERARSAAARYHGHRPTPPAPADIPRPESGVRISWDRGRITAVRISHELLAAGLAGPLGVALARAVNESEPADEVDPALLDQLDPDEVARDLARVAAEIRKEIR